MHLTNFIFTELFSLSLYTKFYKMINKLLNLLINNSFQKIRNGQVGENLFPEKIICDVLESYHF